MIRVQFLTAPGCLECERTKLILQQIEKQLPYLKLNVEEVDLSTVQGLQMAIKYSVLSNPGIVIENKLFSAGHVDEEKLINRLKYIYQSSHQ